MTHDDQRKGTTMAHALAKIRMTIAALETYSGLRPLDRTILDLLDTLARERATQPVNSAVLLHAALRDSDLRSRVRTALATYAHDGAWSGWMKYLFEQSIANADGTVTIPTWAVTRWHRQAATPFHALPESERESDYTEADAMLAAIERVLTHEA